jgi:hypothetical protein
VTAAASRGSVIGCAAKAPSIAQRLLAAGCCPASRGLARKKEMIERTVPQVMLRSKDWSR